MRHGCGVLRRTYPVVRRRRWRGILRLLGSGWSSVNPRDRRVLRSLGDMVGRPSPTVRLDCLHQGRGVYLGLVRDPQRADEPCVSWWRHGLSHTGRSRDHGALSVVSCLLLNKDGLARAFISARNVRPPWIAARPGGSIGVNLCALVEGTGVVFGVESHGV